MRQEDPFTFLVSALGDVHAGRGAGHAIVESERAGQAALCNANTQACELPRRMDPEARTILEAAGVKFLGDVADDPLFQRAQLPPGWKIKPTDHQMHSNLCDEKGRVRATIFYKAAFYDRSASLTISRRFNIASFYNDDHQAIAVARVEDQGAVLFESERLPILNDDDRYGAKIPGKPSHERAPTKRDLARQQCVAYLAEHYPDWENPATYWD